MLKLFSVILIQVRIKLDRKLDRKKQSRHSKIKSIKNKLFSPFLFIFLIIYPPDKSIFIISFYVFHYIVHHRCELCMPRHRRFHILNSHSYLTFSPHLIFPLVSVFHFFFFPSPLLLMMLLICSVLSFGSSVHFFSACFPFCPLCYVSFSCSSLSLDNRQALLLCHFSGRQPLIHVPIIPFARGPSGPGTKDAGSQASLLSLQSFSLLSFLTCVSFFSSHWPVILSCLYCRSCSVSFPSLSTLPPPFITHCLMSSLYLFCFSFLLTTSSSLVCFSSFSSSVISLCSTFCTCYSSHSQSREDSWAV